MLACMSNAGAAGNILTPACQGARNYEESRIVQLTMCAMVVFGGVGTAFADTIYSFTTIDVPGAGGTETRGINDSGQIVGESSLGAFVDTGGTFTLINVPGASSTGPSGSTTAARSWEI